MRWLWIDKIIDFEEGKFLRAIKAVTPGEEQLHSPIDSEGNALPPTMPSTFIIEGMAQAAGILVGTATRFSEKVVLAKITKASFDREIGVGELIRFSAELDRLDDQGAATSGFIDVRLRGPTAKCSAVGKSWHRGSHFWPPGPQYVWHRVPRRELCILR